MHQRKFRNAEERRAIVEEAVGGLASLPLPGNHPVIRSLAATLARFQVIERGTLQGRVEVPDMGCAVEYHLPSRRVLRHFVRVVKSSP